MRKRIGCCAVPIAGRGCTRDDYKVHQVHGGARGALGAGALAPSTRCTRTRGHPVHQGYLSCQCQTRCSFGGLWKQWALPSDPKRFWRCLRMKLHRNAKTTPVDARSFFDRPRASPGLDASGAPLRPSGSACGRSPNGSARRRAGRPGAVEDAIVAPAPNTARSPRIAQDGGDPRASGSTRATSWEISGRAGRARGRR